MTVKERGCICLKINLFKKEKERNARRRVILEKLTVAEMLNHIPQFTGTSLRIPRFTAAQVIQREV